MRQITTFEELCDPDALRQEERERKALAERVHVLFQEAIKRPSFTIDEAAALMQEALQGHELDAHLAALFLLVGMRVGHKHTSGKGGAVESAAAPLVKELLRTTDWSDTKIAKESQKHPSGGMSRPGVSNLRKKLSA